jgi:hypothetical protein
MYRVGIKVTGILTGAPTALYVLAEIVLHILRIPHWHP